MWSLSSIGCGVFVYLQLMDQRGCDELRQQESTLDTLMWFKLLFVPTLGIVLLTLFLLEDYCAQQQQPGTTTDPAAPLLNLHAHSHGQACHHAHHGHSCTTPPLLVQPKLIESSAKRKNSASTTNTEQSLIASSTSTSTSTSSPSSSSSNPFAHPLTLLTPVRTPEPSVVYPIVPNAASTYTNPCDILAGASRQSRVAALQPIVNAQTTAFTNMGLSSSILTHIITSSSPTSSSAVSASALTLQPGYFRIQVMNEAGASTFFVVSTQSTMRDLVSTYSLLDNQACYSSSSDTSSTNGAPHIGMKETVWSWRYDGKKIGSQHEKDTIAKLVGRDSEGRRVVKKEGKSSSSSSTAHTTSSTKGLKKKHDSAPAMDTHLSSTSTTDASSSNSPSSRSSSAAISPPSSPTPSSPLSAVASELVSDAISTSLASSSSSPSLTSAASPRSSPSPSPSLDTSIDLFTVETDFSMLHSALRAEMDRELATLQEKLDLESSGLSELEKQWLALEEKYKKEQAQVLKKKQEIETNQAERAKISQELDEIKATLQSETTLLSDTKRAKLQAEGSDSERTEMKRLDRQKNQLLKELDVLNKDLTEFQDKYDRVEKEKKQLEKDLSIVKEKMNHLEEEVVKLQPYELVDVPTGSVQSSPAGSDRNTSSRPSPSSSIASTPRLANSTLNTNNGSSPSVTRAGSVSVAGGGGAAAASAALASLSQTTLASLSASGLTPLPLLTSYLESLEKQHVEYNAARKKIEWIQAESQHKREEIHVLQKKVFAMNVGINGGAPGMMNGNGVNGNGSMLNNNSSLLVSLNDDPNSNNGMFQPNVSTPSSTTSSSSRGERSHNNSEQDIPLTKLDALPSLRQRVAQLDASTRDLLRWKAVAKNLEAESKESGRWKSLLRASVQRERAMESMLSELNQLKIRTSAFEYEAEVLREYKRNMMKRQAQALEESNGSNIDGSSVSGSGSADFYTPTHAHSHASNSWRIGSYNSMAYDGSEVDGDANETIEPNEAYQRRAEEEVSAANMSGNQPHPTNTIDSAANGSSANPPITDALAAHHNQGHHNQLLAQLQQQQQAQQHQQQNNHATLAHSPHMSDELYAAELEEERLVAHMVSRSQQQHPSQHNNGTNTVADSLTHTNNTYNDEDDLFRLGEALVRRNQHLHQHRLMLRYQQQQQQMSQLLSQQQHATHGNTNMSIQEILHQHGMTPQQIQAHIQGMHQAQAQAQQQQQQHQHHSVGPSSSDGSIGHSIYTPAPKSGLTGVLQASAPVFTPRFQTDSAVTVSGTAIGGGVVGGGSKIPSHYTRASPGSSSAASIVPSPTASPVLWSQSPTHSSLSYDEPSLTASIPGFESHQQQARQPQHQPGAHSHVDLDPSAYWNASLQSMLDEIDSARSNSSSVTSGVGAMHSSQPTRDRAFSQPSQVLDPQLSMYSLTSLSPHQQHSTSIESSPYSSMSSLGNPNGQLSSIDPAHAHQHNFDSVLAPPFGSFRRNQNLTIIDDDTDHGTSMMNDDAMLRRNGYVGGVGAAGGGVGGGIVDDGMFAHSLNLFSSTGAPRTVDTTSSTAPSIATAPISRVNSGSTSPLHANAFGFGQQR